tara:strand:+ start:74 stop:328 length:255 start_codon:yes stop_codon:yes gene_type:complete
MSRGQLHISEHNFTYKGPCFICGKEREEVEFPESNTDFPKGYKDYRCFDENCEAYCWAGVTSYASGSDKPEPEEYEQDGWERVI